MVDDGPLSLFSSTKDKEFVVWPRIFLFFVRNKIFGRLIVVDNLRTLTSIGKIQGPANIGMQIHINTTQHLWIEPRPPTYDDAAINDDSIDKDVTFWAGLGGICCSLHGFSEGESVVNGGMYLQRYVYSAAFLKLLLNLALGTSTTMGAERKPRGFRMPLASCSRIYEIIYSILKNGQCFERSDDRYSHRKFRCVRWWWPTSER